MSSVSKLTLTSFRSYEFLRLQAGTGPVVITGPNGAGKTNLLEAISLLGPGRGLRNARLSEMARIGGGGRWGVAASIVTPGGQREVGTGAADTPERRLVRVDGVNRGQSSLPDLGSIVWLTPAMDRLFTESAGNRRRFLDRIVFGHDPAHATRVNRYEQAVRERQKLLEQARHAAWLDGIESVIAETGIAVAAARQRMVLRLDEACAAADGGPFPAPALTIDGVLEAWLSQAPALTVEDLFRERLRAERALDAASGRCTTGAHRSDFSGRYREKDVPAALASTGEQKALLIAIILAHAELLRAATGDGPILLLDEITAHLDESRRAALFERIGSRGLQAWMSGTDAGSFRVLEGLSLHLHVGGGKIIHGAGE